MISGWGFGAKVHVFPYSYLYVLPPKQRWWSERTNDLFLGYSSAFTNGKIIQIAGKCWHLHRLLRVAFGPFCALAIWYALLTLKCRYVIWVVEIFSLVILLFCFVQLSLCLSKKCGLLRFLISSLKLDDFTQFSIQLRLIAKRQASPEPYQIITKNMLSAHDDYHKCPRWMEPDKGHRLSGWGHDFQ